MACVRKALAQSAGSALTEGVWLSKGIANALMRIPGKTEEASAHYRKVIEACEGSLGAGPNPRVIALAAWCYHCIGDYESAIEYYEVVHRTDEISAAGLFDFTLVVSIARSKFGISCGTDPKILMREALDRSAKKSVLRECGFFRIAIHDCREMVFRDPELENSELLASYKKQLISELRSRLATNPFDGDAYKDRMLGFITIAEPAPPGRGNAL